MNKNLYAKLARTNIKKNRNTYFPYIFSSIVVISMFNILLTITNRAKKADFYGDSAMTAILMFGVFIIGLFSLLFIFYTNSFLLKRRTKELGLYSVLGMEKKHIVKVLFYEVLYSSLFSMGAGLIVGLLFSKLMFALLLNILNLDTSISLSISWFSIVATIILFILIYLIVLVYNIIKGIFLGTLFVITTVLIIYYKQISEGYDDRERFIILQKVGMSKEEVKKTIKSQILLVFFLPLVTAIIHIVVAFPLVRKILALLNLTNTKLSLSLTAIVILVFTLGYRIVYKWTARVYYRIVN